jgi:hypothetical protein
MVSGRLTDYSDELVEKAQAYANGGWRESGDQLPQIAGLAIELGISRETVYAWSRDPNKGIFSDIVMRIRAAQERALVNGGLDGRFNASVTKLMLHKHDYSERVETDIKSTDGSMTPSRGLDPSTLSTETLRELMAAKKINAEQ